MNAVEQGAKVATTAIESMKSQPLALALVVVNVLFLIGGVGRELGIGTRKVQQALEAHD